MGRSAHDGSPATGDPSAMHEHGSLHRIEEDLAEGATEQWAAAGLRELEEYLAKHAAFLTFLEAHE
jgi:hypothetical protein